ncbi:MAG: CoB--CoM heterodisulfide reductase iron-sulfur subunit B family protein [Candidatus Eremiobacteraeota bacterium]|nr:CoB--CoM heterodisulfide reductase iron-sulfur subunit B family protein [Candidatus Eremiobacteraeota bacterium]
MKDRYALYEGCSLHGTGREYYESLKAVFKILAVRLDKVQHWTCCGTSSRISESPLVAAALPLRNIIQAEKQGKTDVLAPCAACFARLKDSLYKYREKAELRESLRSLFEYDFKDSVKVLHPLEVLAEREGLKIIREKVKMSLKGVRAVAYYGCLITRPPEIMQCDDPEYPLHMDRILAAAGIEMLDWSYKTECCGASLSLTRKDVVITLCERILTEAVARGADVIAVACPLCHANLDMRQKEVEEKSQKKSSIPILYFTELLSLAFGIPPSQVPLSRHLTSAAPLLEKIGALSKG